MKNILLSILFVFICTQLTAQKIYRSNDRFGVVKGDCIALIEGDKVFRTTGPFCRKSNCMYILQQDRVFKGTGAFCMRGNCEFVLDGNYFYESDDPSGNFLGNMLFIVEQNRIYKAVGNFRKGDCLYIVEDNKVFNSFNPFGSMKDDCILIIEGENIAVIDLLAILARTF